MSDAVAGREGDGRVPGDLRREEPALSADECARLGSAIARHFAVAEAAVTLSRHRVRKDLPDVTLKYRVGIAGAAHEYFLHISPRAAPQTMAETAERTGRVAELLGPASRARVLLPEFMGSLDGRSYTLTRGLGGFSTTRVVGRLQRYALAPFVFDWLRDSLRDTAHEVSASLPVAQLDALCAMPGLDPLVGHAARAARARFESGELRPVFALNHRDLWSGNILFEPLAFGQLPSRRFALIDWGAATAEACPGYDVIRYALDARIPAWYAGQRIAGLARELDCGRADFVDYVLASLAGLSRELDNWPVASFLQVCTEVYAGATRMCR